MKAQSHKNLLRREGRKRQEESRAAQTGMVNVRGSRAKTWLLACLVVMLSLSALIFPRLIERPLLHWSGGDVLSDPDSYMQWRLVRRALDGETARIRWIDDDNAPIGRLNEWTSPMVLIGKGAVGTMQRLTGWPRDRADEFCRVWLGPALGLVALAVLVACGRAAGGWTMAGCWAIAWPLPAMIIAMTRCGNVNHQGLHLLLFTASLGACIAGREQVGRVGYAPASAAIWGALLGLLNAVSIWAGASELLPICVLIALLAAWDCASPQVAPTLRLFWRGWWCAGLVGTAAALMYEFGPGSPPGGPGIWHHLEFISIWHVGLWVLAAIGVEWPRTWRVSPRLRFLIWLGGSVIAAVVFAGAVRNFDWGDLHIVQDARFSQLVGEVSEFAPYFSGPSAARVTFTDFGLLPLVLLLLIAGRRKVRTKDRTTRSASRSWWWLAAVLATFFVLMLVACRWSAYFATALVMLAGFAAVRRWPGQPVRSLGIIFLATLPIWGWEFYIESNIASINGDALQGPYTLQIALELTGQDMADAYSGRTTSAKDDHRPIVLCYWTWGGYLAGGGMVRVVGSQYWSNLGGFEDTLTLFTTTSDEEFWRLCDERQIDCVLISDPRTMMGLIAQAFETRSGSWPSRDQILGTAIWRLAANLRGATVPAPRMNQLKPQWRIVRIR